MEHRDAVILQKVLSEIRIAEDMVGNKSLAEFIGSEMLKRAMCMTKLNRSCKRSLKTIDQDNHHDEGQDSLCKVLIANNDERRRNGRFSA